MRGQPSSSRCGVPTAFRRDSVKGQTLVEFALVIPLVLVLILGTIEFALMFNATLTVNFASRNASLVAAEAGTSSWSDCLVLASVERDMGAPVDRASILSVGIFRANRAGQAVSGALNLYTRTPGSPLSCGSMPSVPYTLAASPNNTYGPAMRCDILAGCQVTSGSPAVTSTVPLDSIGVRITYRYTYHTPIGNFVRALPGGSGILNLTWSNVMRMEPTL